MSKILKRAISYCILYMMIVCQVFPLDIFAVNKLASIKIISIQAIDSKSIKINWNKISNAKYYNVYRTNSIKDKYVKIGRTTVTYYIDKNLKQLTTYWYIIKAVDKQGEEAASKAISIKTQGELPQSPEDIEINSVSSKEVELKWNKVEGRVSYNIYRRMDNGVEYTKIANTLETIYKDKGLISGIYWYKITAVNEAGESEFSNEYNVEVAPEIPEAPTNLKAEISENHRIKLIWNTDGNVNLYNVYRSFSESGNYTNIGTAENNEFIDEDLIHGCCWYKVAGSNKTGEGKASNIVNITLINENNNKKLDGNYKINQINSDRDGLTDYQEIYKYFTNPNKADSDGDGINDGDWNERREYTYTIKSKMKIVRPWNVSVMNDDYQDVKVISETKDYLEFEVIYYPYNKNAEGIKSNLNWKQEYENINEYLKPGITTNWDEKMREDLRKELNKERIYPDRLSDRELVEKVSKWIWISSQTKGNGMPLDFAVYYPEGKATVYSELRAWFDRYKPEGCSTDEDVFNNELFGRQMYYNKKHGTCTSSSIYQATIFKALGIPTRIISTIPILDGNDSSQMDMMLNGLTNDKTKKLLKDSIIRTGMSSHFFNEVYVGNHWVRLNYGKLGANTLGESSCGLVCHINTFSDISENELAKYWGIRLAGRPSPQLSSINPYQMLEISDMYGKYYNASK